MTQDFYREILSEEKVKMKNYKAIEEKIHHEKQQTQQMAGNLNDRIDVQKLQHTCIKMVTELQKDFNKR